MNKKDTTYRMPEGFNQHASLDAVRGLADAIHQFLFVGAGTQRVIPNGDRASLNGLVELLQAEAHALHAYFAELENRTSLDLPLSQEELDALDFRNLKDEVREPAAVYSIR